MTAYDVSQQESDGPAPRSRLRVPPYAVTGGRTRVDVDIPFEALVRTTERGRENMQMIAFERRTFDCRSAQFASWLVTSVSKATYKRRQ